MTRLKPLVLAIAALGLFACSADDPAATASQAAANAEQPAAAHNVDALVRTCTSCHGPKGLSSSSQWPNLAGQKAGYLADQIKAFRDGKRKDTLMAPMVRSLSDQDITALASYFSQQVDDRPRTPIADSAGAHVRARCISCHGKKGKTVNQSWPNLAGQQKGYLAKQLLDYKSGKRKSPIMAVIANELSDQQINDVAEYYSQVSAK